MNSSAPKTAEIWAGLASMLVVLPSAIAFGTLVFSPLGAGAAGAMSGIAGAIVIGIVAPLFGGTRRLISGPSAPAAAVLSALALRLAGLKVAPGHGLFLISLCCLAAGALQLLYGAVGGGRLVKYIPYPVAAGYLSGVGLMIFLSQLPKAVASPETCAVAAVTVALTVLVPRVTKAVPASIAGLLGGVAAYLLLGGRSPAVGQIQSAGLGALAAAAARGGLALDDLKLLAGPALTLSVLLSFDTLKTCVQVDSLSSTRHDSDKELRGQGLANMASALCGGMSGSGQSGPTMVNIDSGATGRLSSVLSGVFCLAAFLLLGRLLAWLPIAALAGVLIVVAFRMFDFKVFGLLKRRRTVFDFFVVAAVIGVAVGVNLIAASAVGVGLSILLFIRDQMSASIIRRRASGSELFSKQNRLPSEMKVLEERGGQTLVCELQGTLFFGTADQLYTELEKDLLVRRYVILGLRRVQALDFTAAHVLSQLQARLAERGGALLFADVPSRVAAALDVEPARVFSELDDALAWTENRLLAEQSAWPRESAPPLELGQIELFQGLGGAESAALESCLERRHFSKGALIFAHGDAGDELFVIRKGRVRIELPLSNAKRHHIATFSRGDSFGEIAFLDEKKRSADAKAASDTDLFVLSRGTLQSQAASVSAELFARLARVLALRLRRTDAELRALQDD